MAKATVFYRFNYSEDEVIVKTETKDGMVHFINDGRNGSIEEYLFNANFTIVEVPEDEASQA